MGQTQSEEERRELFQRLDVDRTGRLNLRELLLSDHPDLAGSSVGFLFRFDTSQEGTINFEEFQELIKYLRRLEAKSSHKKGTFSLKRLLRRSDPKKDQEEVCWKTLDSKSAAGLTIDRDTTTPAFIGCRSRNSSDEIEKRSECPSPNRREEVWKREEQKTRKYLEESLSEMEGRQKFMDWLFKLTDVDKSDRVSADELDFLLRALAKDSINTAELSYDEQQITPLLLQSIMCEYDFGKTGYLSKEEFMVLAELIVRNYDSLKNEKLNVTKIFF